MLTLINTNTMSPPIGPIGLDYIGSAAKTANIEVDLLDLCLIDEPEKALRDYFAVHNPVLIALSFRNVDDSFWPSAKWFVPDFKKLVTKIRRLSDSPIVAGGIGFSIFAERIIDYVGLEFGIRGDGEKSIILLYNQLLSGEKNFADIAGLVWRTKDGLSVNSPTWPSPLSVSSSRDIVDNLAYFRKGGQCGFETKRGCNRNCIYCADPLAKGRTLRLRSPAEIADEVENLFRIGIDVFHTCDAEFNIPKEHADKVCREFIRRKMGRKIQWYAYMAVTPFDKDLAENMRMAGCVGINFTSDSASDFMLKTYRQPHSKKDLASAVKICRDTGITVMLDLLFAGPGETEHTIKETIDFVKQINPDCAGTGLGVRIYPGTQIAQIVLSEGVPEENPSIRRKYTGSVDFFRPTFYISYSLGPNPAQMIRDFIAGDARFFEPELEDDFKKEDRTDHNYNDNDELTKAIAAGARGAYWNILRKLKSN